VGGQTPRRGGFLWNLRGCPRASTAQRHIFTRVPIAGWLSAISTVLWFRLRVRGRLLSEFGIVARSLARVGKHRICGVDRSYSLFRFSMRLGPDGELVRVTGFHARTVRPFNLLRACFFWYPKSLVMFVMVSGHGLGSSFWPIRICPSKQLRFQPSSLGFIRSWWLGPVLRSFCHDSKYCDIILVAFSNLFVSLWKSHHYHATCPFPQPPRQFLANSQPPTTFSA
jgi:hypothetical protein